MADLLAGTTKDGNDLVGELIRKKRVAAVDWKEHPIEVMACLDTLGGKAWTKNANRWDVADSVDLDRAIPEKFLPVAAAALAGAKLALLSFDRDSDEAIFAVVPDPEAKPTLSALKKRKAKSVLVAPAKVTAKKPTAGAKKAEAAANEALAELHEKIAVMPVRDGAGLADFEIHFATRLLIAAGRVEGGEALDNARALFDFVVTNELAGLEAQLFRQHGPHFDGETLGAALLAGRGHELVRGWAHYLSLGQRGKTALWQAFLGRDLPPTWKRGSTDDLDPLLTASDAKFPAAAKQYLTKTWSSFTRGMKGSRASFLVSGLAASRGIHLELGELDPYLLHFAAKPERVLTKPVGGLPKVPPFPSKLGAPRDASRAQDAAVKDARTYADWVDDSLKNAVNEKSGLYLRAVPETAVDVGRCLYAAGAALDDVRAWLSFAVDLEVARCENDYAEDVLGWHDLLREVAGAAMLVGRGARLAKVWGARKANNAPDAMLLEAMRTWLAGKAVTGAKLPRKLPAAVLETLAEKGSETAVEKLARVPLITPHPWPEQPWPGPFSALLTALAKELKDIPSAAKTRSMLELIGGKAEAAPDLDWPKPRVKAAFLKDYREVAAVQMKRVEAAEEVVDRARAALVVARCVHALGAPLAETGKWLRLCVDLAKTTKHVSEDFIGAARLVGRAKELSASLYDYEKEGAERAPELAFMNALEAYALNKPIALEPILKKRYFYLEFATAAVAAREGDLKGLSAALAKAPWQHRREWTAGDNRKRPVDLSWFVMALAVDAGGLDGIPPVARPFIDEELVRAAMESAL